ncbi:MAG: histidine phosphatase family protein [Psychrobacillus sp.]
MRTVVYMIRHSESPLEGDDRSRGLTQKGYLDAKRVYDTLKDKEIEIVVSSPYTRSILTVEKLAQQIGGDVLIFEDLKERKFASGENRPSDEELAPLLEMSFSDSNFSLEGGESNTDCQKRAIKVMIELLDNFKNKTIVIGTHGVVMTLMLGYYDNKYDLKFLQSTTKPDIYRLEFNQQELVNVKRLKIVDNE